MSTKDFIDKMDCFLMKEEGGGEVHLRAVKKSKGLTQGVLAEILGISKSYIVQMEAGNKKLCKKA
ncbi:helix-turn-helix domain-containing protein [Acidobacteriota bacterium]